LTKKLSNSIRLALALGLAVLVTQTCLMAATCAPAPAGIVAWWPGNGDATDIAGTNSGSFINEAYVNAEVGQGFSLDGSGNIFVPASATLDLGQSNGMTIEAWINPSDVSSGAPILEWALPGTYGVHFWVSGSTAGSLYANLFGIDNVSRSIESNGGLLTANVFQHVAVTYDKSSGIARLFLNGVLVKQSTLGTFTPRTSPNFYIGYRPDGSPFGPIGFVGIIDEVTLYSRALATNEVLAIYNAGASGKCAVPIPSPSLNIALTNQNIVLDWPASATNFALEVTYGSLLPAGTWTNLAVSPVLTNNENVVTLPFDPPTRFFRLHHL
jgi:hypothetical protein